MSKRNNKRGAKLTEGLGWCSKCENFLPLENFHKDNGNKFGYFYCCTRCHYIFSSKSESRLKYNRVTRKRNRKLLKAHYKKLLGGKCARCGYSNSFSALDWHHVDPLLKQNNVSQLVDSVARDDKEMIDELDKTILLCANCHREFEAGEWFAIFSKNNGVGWSIQLGTIKTSPGSKG